MAIARTYTAKATTGFPRTPAGSVRYHQYPGQFLHQQKSAADHSKISDIQLLPGRNCDRRSFIIAPDGVTPPSEKASGGQITQYSTRLQVKSEGFRSVAEVVKFTGKYWL